LFNCDIYFVWKSGFGYWLFWRIVFARVKEETRELGFGDWGIRKLGVPNIPFSQSPNPDLPIPQYLSIPLFLREEAKALELSQDEL
jgi:hypothetical protein